MLTLQEVLDLQTQNKITITLATTNTRYHILRAFTEDGQYYINEFGLMLFNMHTKNYDTIMERARLYYKGAISDNALILIDNKLYVIFVKDYTADGEELIELRPFDGEEFATLMKKGEIAYSNRASVQNALHRLVFSTDRYPLGFRRRCDKPRKYRKSEIQASSLSQEKKNYLCEKHSNYFVLFTQSGEYIGLFPRCENYTEIDINSENITHINDTLSNLYGEKVFELDWFKFEERLLTEGLILC